MAENVQIPAVPSFRTLSRMREALAWSDDPSGPKGMRAAYDAIVAEATRPNTQTEQERP